MIYILRSFNNKILDKFSEIQNMCLINLHSCFKKSNNLFIKISFIQEYKKIYLVNLKFHMNIQSKKVLKIGY